MRRKSEDTIGRKRRRMPFVAKVRREDPFRHEDEAEIQAMSKRIAAAAEHFTSAGWREDAGFRLFHFTTWAKARAMQHWIDRTNLAKRPMPKLGPTKEETAAERRALLDWALGTGALRTIVQAYRRRVFAGDTHIAASCEAYRVATAVDCKRDGLVLAVDYLIQWARENHADWFERCRPPEEPVPAAKPTDTVVTLRRPTPAEPTPPRWRPMF